tara:strand:+ start:7139 stop:8185 length:1047 start_codon:yes stop_codon:yes gene_type:complete
VEGRGIAGIAMLLVVLLAFVLGAFLTSGADRYVIPHVSAEPIATVAPTLVVDAPDGRARPHQRTSEPYLGLGTWVDLFDADPEVAPAAPTVYPAGVVGMAAQGVRTLFLQGARASEGARFPTADPWLLAEYLLAGHASDMAVVAWYLPMWEAGDEDLDRLVALSAFEVMGHRFDGISVDIEWKDDDLEPEERSRRLVELGQRLRSTVGTDTLGAIVMPPVVTDVINRDFWPGFPWDGIRSTYDVWLPMAYWSFRTEEHADPAYYTAENIRLLRELLGDGSAVVHGIGGVGAADGSDLPDPGEPLALVEDLEGFLAALEEVGAVGGSIYDWATTGPEARRRLAEAFSAS